MSRSRLAITVLLLDLAGCSGGSPKGDSDASPGGPGDVAPPPEPDGPPGDGPAPAADGGTAAERPPPGDAGAPDSSPPAGDGPASPSLGTIHFFGRWNLSGSGRAVTVNGGSHLTAQFDGTALVARFDVSQNRAPLPTLAWQIDDMEWQEAEVSAAVPLATALPAGRHRVTLMARALDEHQSRWSPPLVASLTFLALEVTGGALVPSARPARKKIEFLGNSLTEGVLQHPVRPGKTTWPWQTDGRTAYPTQTALKLGAEWRQVGFGRQGITMPGNGGVPAALDSFKWIYAGVPRDDWQADLVVVNEGENDDGVPPEVLRPAVARYLDEIRQAYPTAHLAVLRPFSGSSADVLAAEVAARTQAGDARISYIDTTGWLTAGDFTDGVHPNLQGSAKVAELLAAKLAPLL